MTWPNRKDSSYGRGLKRTGLKQKSAKGDARDNAWLRALCYAHLELQAINGRYYCFFCGRHQADGILEALEILQPCHVEPRKDDEGHGVRFGADGKVTRIGTDSFDNIRPGCASCNRLQHEQERSDPEWSKS